MVHENISAGRNYEFFILPFFAMRRISNLKEKSFKTKKTVEKIFLLFLRKFEEFGLSMSCAVRRQEGCLHRVLRSAKFDEILSSGKHLLTGQRAFAYWAFATQQLQRRAAFSLVSRPLFFSALRCRVSILGWNDKYLFIVLFHVLEQRTANKPALASFAI